MKYRIVVTKQAEKDLSGLPEEMEETFISKKNSVERNLNLGAEPGEAFDKYLSGNMHPVLQMNLGRDYRSWFLEGVYVEGLEDDKIFCWRVLTKKEAKKLTGRVADPLEIFRRSRG